MLLSQGEVRPGIVMGQHYGESPFAPTNGAYVTHVSANDAWGFAAQTSPTNHTHTLPIVPASRALYTVRQGSAGFELANAALENVLISCVARVPLRPTPARRPNMRLSNKSER